MLFQRSPGRINIKLIGSCGKVKFSVPFHFGAVKRICQNAPWSTNQVLVSKIIPYSLTLTVHPISSHFNIFCLSDKTLHQKLHLSFIWAVQIVQNTHDFLDNGRCWSAITIWRWLHKLSDIRWQNGRISKTLRTCQDIRHRGAHHGAHGGDFIWGSYLSGRSESSL